MAKMNQIALRFIQPLDHLKILENMGDGESFSPLLRSSVLHGVTIDNKRLLQLEQVCIQTDALLRKVFSIILTSKSMEPDFFKMFTAEEKQLQEFLSDLLFSTKDPLKDQDTIS
jgi:glutamate/tyrosine decarboxylase-like PLP-dependent enzyme